MFKKIIDLFGFISVPVAGVIISVFLWIEFIKYVVRTME